MADASFEVNCSNPSTYLMRHRKQFTFGYHPSDETVAHAHKHRRTHNKPKNVIINDVCKGINLSEITEAERPFGRKRKCFYIQPGSLVGSRFGSGRLKFYFDFIIVRVDDQAFYFSVSGCFCDLVDLKNSPQHCIGRDLCSLLFRRALKYMDM